LPVIALAGGAAEKKPVTVRERLGGTLKTANGLFNNAASDNRFSANDKKRRDQLGHSGPSILSDDSQADCAAYRRDLRERYAKARLEIAGELAQLPPELEAKIERGGEGGFGWSRLGEFVGGHRLIANIHSSQLVAPFFYSFPEFPQFLLKPLFP
jgi:hypothetical protein